MPGEEAAAPAEESAPERELSKGTAVVVTIAVAVAVGLVLMLVFHWLGFGIPLVGWILAKGALKAAVFIVFVVAGLVAAVAQKLGKGTKGSGDADA
ncbi:hypothetical protein ACWGB8_24870 [Kitasatospora sp. NPDC054939]